MTTFNAGRGYPFSEPSRLVNTHQDQQSPYPDNSTNPNVVIPPLADIPALTGGAINLSNTTNGGGGNLDLPTRFSKKVIRVVQIPLDNLFDDQVHNIPGTFIACTGQFGGNVAPFGIRLDSFDNDIMTFVFDRAFSGVPFSQFYISNFTAQPGVVMELTIITDGTIDRVAEN